MATVLAELAERVVPQLLAGIAPLVRLPDVQRLGYLLDAVAQGKVAAPLALRLAAQGPRTVPLHSGGGTDAEPDPRWHVVPNVELEVEV